MSDLFLRQVEKAVWSGGQSLVWRSAIWVQPWLLHCLGAALRKPLGLPKEGGQMAPEDRPPRPMLLWWASYLLAAQFLYSWKTEISYGKRVWRCSQKGWERSLKEKWGKNSKNLRVEPRPSSEPWCPLVSQNWMGRGEWSWGPSFHFLWKPPLGLWLWFLFIS